MKLAPHTHLLTVALGLGLVACTSDDEKMMRFEEELATIVETNAGDCNRMAAELTKLADAKGKDIQALKRKMLPKGADAKTALDARLDEKFGERRKALDAKVRAGMQCMLTEPVAAAMLAIQGDGENQPNRAAPERPATGAPVAFVVDKLGTEAIDVSVYNFGDKTFAHYGLRIRYTDAAGAPLKAKYAFNAASLHWSIAGSAYRVPPKQWRRFVLDHLETPAGAVKAEVLVDEVRASTAAGVKVEDTPTWKLQGTSDDWPLARAN